MYYYKCTCCGQKSWNNEIAKLAGKDLDKNSHTPHDNWCPGKTFPENWVSRVEV